MFIIMFLFLIESIQEYCEPYGVRLFLGHYYTNLKIETDALRIVFNTKNQCNKQFQVFIKGDQEFNITTYKTKFLNMTDIYVGTKANIEYETYIHTFQIPIQQTSRILYALKNNDKLIKEAQVKLPQLQQDTTKVLFFGDMDSRWLFNRSKQTFDWFEEQINQNIEYDSLLFTGDMAYDLESDNCERGELWISRISLFTSQYPFMISPGNHDGGFDYKQTFLREHFQMLYLTEYDTQNYQNDFYSFNIGMVHFIQYDPVMIVYKADPNNYIKNRLLSQFRNDLSKAVQNREEVPWIVVFTHYPIYCNFMDDDQCVNNFKYLAEFEKLFQEFHVDLYVSGHQHNYQRNQPYYQNHSVSYQIDGNIYYNYESPITIIEGAGGADYGPEIMIYNDQPYTAKQLAQNGVGLLQVMNKTHLQFQHIRVSTNQVMDEIWIMKTYDKEKDNSFEYWIITIIICAIVIVLALFIFIFVKYKGRKSKTYQKAMDNLV
ncbi:unnamed protein product (macronuclear) [Paramecium tetraurelia]|uniref:Calcineurin-like phosphoesterase domain-containing protein n=1 Tax=Paramecium tetraurelia TaxID=5888 RepID=A0EIM3_PARTE|nr:uncharacterized protein GSPATT00027493001 [Paramecium tetraurelia]CAK95164.1 unnamed protein product [Paramecium tetraurelia]|eukprot:XP_001462537.1 hypothetical protein (macronuclear) [Paramecium tetraurelia strain d4-2]